MRRRVGPASTERDWILKRHSSRTERTKRSANALHESIHALQAELWAFNNEASGWIHEAHNWYLGTQRTHVVYDQYTMGYGAAASLQMPHIPIESMGVLTDDTSSWEYLHCE